MGATIAKERLYSSIEASNERDIRKIIEVLYYIKLYYTCIFIFKKK